MVNHLTEAENPETELVTAGVVSKLRRYFKRHAPRDVLAAYLFGSYARRSSTPESDVDVGVVLKTNVQADAGQWFELRLQLIGEIVHVLHHNEVDVLLLNQAPPPLAVKVVATGILLFRCDAAALHVWERDVQLRAGDLAPFLRRMRLLQLERLTA